MHRDIKPSNILINADCSITLADFGMARHLDFEHDLTAYIVNRCYRAPEIMLSPRNYNIKIDIWSVGCCMYEALVGEPLFSGNDYLEVLRKILETMGLPDKEELAFVTNKKGIEFVMAFEKTEQTLPSQILREKKSLLPAIDPLIFDLIDLCLKINPNKRTSAEEAMRHPYFAEIFNPADIVKFEGQLDLSFEKPQSLSFEDVCSVIEHQVGAGV